jgi:tetratricopeptide (TPR) repeat protein
MDEKSNSGSAPSSLREPDRPLGAQPGVNQCVSNPRFRLVSSLILVLATLGAFLPVLHNDFINLDDRLYVVENPHVATGLRAVNLLWALTSGYASNWHPLTWFSHMVDVQLFGMDPAWHHAVSLLLHVVNSVILLFLLSNLTGAPWRSFAVAGLFALHPLHVESVAWVAERKDVLSTLFFLLTIWAYAEYVARRSSPRTQLQAVSGSNQDTLSNREVIRPYLLALVLFGLALMSKPMVVSTPFVLLLLDYWPLGRMGGPGEEFSVKRALELLREKVPFFIMAAASSLVTFLAQAGSHSVKSFLPLSLRIKNAIVSYVLYLGKTIWPANLAVFYPHPNTRYHLQTDLAHPASEQWPLPLILAAAVAGILFTLALVRWRRRMPWLLIGWLWFLGTLVPVIGVVQVGMQAMADRYTYIALIGVFLGVVWTIGETLSRLSVGRVVLRSMLILALLGCWMATRTQVMYWRNDFTLFNHALAVTSHNAMAECHVGTGCALAGNLDLAQSHFKAALEDDPFFFEAHSNLGSLFEMQGKNELALEQYRKTLSVSPWDEFGHLHLAGVLRKLGRDNDAIAEYRENLQSNPDSVQGNYELGALLLDRGDLDSASRFLRRTVALQPGHVDALLCLSDLYSKKGQVPAAEATLEKVVELYPTNFELRINLAGLLWQADKQAQALLQYSNAVRLQPGSPIGHYNLGLAYAAQGKAFEATQEFAEAVRLGPDNVDALSELAWLLATNPRPQQRDGARALILAKHSLELSAGKQARAWAALDVAYAETGQFAEAIKAAEKARDLAASHGQTNAVKAAEARLVLYTNNQPFHIEEH